MVRRATLKDSAVIRKMLTRVWNDTHGHIPIDDTKLLKVTHKFMTNPQCVVFLSDVDGVKGMLAASVSPLDIGIGKAATDHVFYCRSGEGRELIQAYVEWAKEKGAVMIGMSVSSGLEQADKLIQSAGFKAIGGVYMYE